MPSEQAAPSVVAMVRPTWFPAPTVVSWTSTASLTLAGSHGPVGTGGGNGLLFVVSVAPG